MKGTIYTETLVHAAPRAFVNEAPYQLVIVDLEDGRRVTGRVEGERARIGDPVSLIEERNSVPFFRKEGGAPAGQVKDAEKVDPQEPVKELV